MPVGRPAPGVVAVVLGVVLGVAVSDGNDSSAGVSVGVGVLFGVTAVVGGLDVAEGFAGAPGVQPASARPAMAATADAERRDRQAWCGIWDPIG